VSRASLVLGLSLFLSALGGGLYYGLVTVSGSGEEVAVLDHAGGAAALALDLSPDMNPLRASLSVAYSTRLAMTGAPLRADVTLVGPSGLPLWTKRLRLQEVGETGVGRTRQSMPVQRFDVPAAGRHRLTLAFRDGRGATVDEARVTVRRNVTVMSWPLVGAFVSAGAVGLLLLLVAGAVTQGRRA
jgi:hypothetical protein